MFLKSSLILIMTLFGFHLKSYADELAADNAPELQSIENTTSNFEDTPRKNFNECTDQEKKEREVLHNNCQNDYQTFGLSRPIRPEHLVEKLSCRRIENVLFEAAIGCAKHVASFPKDVFDLVTNLFINEEIEESVKMYCGEYPPRPEIIRTSAEAGTRAHFEATIAYNEAVILYRTCRRSTRRMLREKKQEQNQILRATTTRIRAACSGTYRGRSRVRYEQSRAYKNCALDYLKDNEVQCPACISKFSPMEINPLFSGAFKAILTELRQLNPQAYACYSPERLGILACTAFETASGVGGATRALTRAFGRNAAEKAIKMSSMALNLSRQDGFVEAVTQDPDFIRNQLNRQNNNPALLNSLNVNNKINPEVFQQNLVQNISSLPDTDRKKINDYLKSVQDETSGEFNRYRNQGDVNLTLNSKGAADANIHTLEGLFELVPSLRAIPENQKQVLLRKWGSCDIQ